MEKQTESRFLKWPVVLLVSAVFPPAGVVLTWLRPLTGGVVRRLAGLTGRLAFSGVLAVVTVAYASLLGLVHVELSGAGWKPIFSLRDPRDDQTALESHRLAQQQPPPLVAESVPTPVPDVANPPPLMEATGPMWTDFRGANREGRYTEGPIRTAFPSGAPDLLWRQPVGGGYASFVIANGRAYTIEQRRDREVVAAYNVLTGRELWTHGWAALFSEIMGGDGPRATPVWDSGRIYALGASGHLAVLDAGSGKPIWSKNILTENQAENVAWGMSNSPLIVEEKVIVTPGGPSGRSVVAYDKSTGERLWGALDDRAAYMSPMLMTLAGRRQVVLATAARIVSLTPEDGKLLWEYPWVTMQGINSAQPIATDANHVFVSAGYDHGSVLLEIEEAGGGLSAKAVWENRNLKNRFNSSVLHDHYIYGFDEGIFACIDARTGERKWKGGRYGYGQALLAGDHILVLTESGEVVLLEATPEAHREVARFSAIEGKTWNHPAIAGGILLVRNAREMAAFRLGR